MFGNQKRYFKKLVEISLRSVVKDGGGENGFSLPSTLVDFVLEKDGVEFARELYKKCVRKLPSAA